jgi:hypothetical protein
MKYLSFTAAIEILALLIVVVGKVVDVTSHSLVAIEQHVIVLRHLMFQHDEPRMIATTTTTTATATTTTSPSISSS